MKKIFVLTEYFYPAFKAGGPIQSITNLILALEHEHSFYVVTNAYDLRSEEVMDINTNNWNQVMLPGGRKPVSVWYAEPGKLTYKTFTGLLKEINPGMVYMNGIFSFRFFLVPLIASKFYRNKLKIIICPRGMLQKGALSGKSFKKKIYLKSLKLSGLLKNIHWHATNLDEKNDIVRQFPAGDNITIAMNIPKKPLPEITIPEKNPGSLRLIYLSLIAEKKNLLFLLTIIHSLKNIVLDIYGPVKDVAYWNECKKMIARMPEKVRYCGDVLPVNVQKTLSEYHALALLTRGENFGHALYESLSAGRPVITSDYTPWNNLKDVSAGWNVDIKNSEGCAMAFNELRDMPGDEYSLFCKGAFNLARNYYNSLEIDKSYGLLFS